MLTRFEIQHTLGDVIISGIPSEKQRQMCSRSAKGALACSAETRRMAIASAEPKLVRALNVAAGRTSHRLVSFAGRTVDATQG